MKREAKFPIRVIFYKDEDDTSVWVAHCLEFDLIGHGETQKLALKMLSDAIAEQLKSTLKSGNLKNLFTQAPAEYQMMYAKGTDIVDGEVQLKVHVDDFEIEDVDPREYRDSYSETDSECYAMA